MRTLSRTMRVTPYVGALLFSTAIPAFADMSSAVRTSQQVRRDCRRPPRSSSTAGASRTSTRVGQRDAFFLQGCNAARDRLWQIDLWRKRGLGRLAASFGPAYVAQDRAARLFLYRGDMGAEWAAYGPGARESVEAFAAGVNAYVAEVKAGKRPLPVEFSITHSQPETWNPEDILRIRSHALVSNVTSEVARARVVCAGGVEAEACAASWSRRTSSPCQGPEPLRRAGGRAGRLRLAPPSGQLQTPGARRPPRPTPCAGWPR